MTTSVINSVLNTKIKEVDDKIPEFSGLVKKQIMMLKYQKWRENSLLILIIINLQMTYLMQR